MLCRTGRIYSLFNRELEVSIRYRYQCHDMLIPLPKEFDLTKKFGCIKRDIYTRPHRIRHHHYATFLLIGLHMRCDFQDGRDMLMQSRVMLHAADKSYSMFPNTSFKINRSISYSPNVLGFILQQLSHLLYSPDDAVLFNGDRLSHFQVALWALDQRRNT